MILISVIFLVLGILIHKFEMYFLLSGYNMMTQSQKNNIDSKNYGKYFGIHMYILSVIFLITGILSKKFPNMEIMGLFFSIIIFINLIWRGNKKYNKNESTGEAKYSLIILVIPLIIIIATLSYSMKSIQVEGTNNSIIVEGKTINFNEIVSMELINKVPSTNKIFGSGFGAHKKGDFEVSGYGNAKVFTDIQNGETLVVKTRQELYIINSNNKEIIKNIYKNFKEHK